MSAATSVKLVIPSEIRFVDLIHDASEKVAAMSGLNEDESLNVGLAVREAVINAIKHGNRLDPARRVDVTLVSKGDAMSARVVDQGRGFDPSASPDPTSEENRLRTSGRGLLLIRSFVDAVEFDFRPGRGMAVTLTKRIRHEFPASANIIQGR